MGDGGGAATLVDALRRHVAVEGDRTAYEFLADGETDVRTMTYAELDARSRGVAGALGDRGGVAARAVLLYEPGLEFIRALFGCLRAGVVAVPVYPPDARDPAGGLERIQAIAADAEAELVLTTDAMWAALEPALRRVPGLRRCEWCATDALAPESAAAFRDTPIDPEDVAFLQYTSGSTATPKGVMVTHRNIVAQARGVAATLALSRDSVVVSWLPLYHDMGLVGTVLIPMDVGCRSVQMSPLAFLERPVRWLRAITRHRGTLSAAPNFAFDLCVRRTTPAERRELDLECWAAAMNGAEPIRSETCERFIATFAPHGFRAEAIVPCYGLAESTLMVAGGPVGRRLRTRRVDAGALARHRLVEAAPGAGGARTVVGCGRVVSGYDLRVVQPETARACAADEVGELWVRGPCVASGYWGRRADTATTFGARLATGEGPFLRTGDLGFLREGVLFVTGRLTDLVIVHGRNYYPQDLERTAEGAHAALRAGGGAAFVLDEDDASRLAIVHEIEPTGWESTGDVIRALRNAVARAHGVALHVVVLIHPRTLPKTSSGKVRRRACRAALVAGALSKVAEWRADGGMAPPVDRYGGRAGAGERDPVRIGDRLVEMVAALREMPAAAVHRQDDFAALGLDSAEAAQLAADLEAWLARPVPLALLLEHPSIDRLATALGDAS